MTPSPFRHLGLKLLSVLLGVMLWMVVAGEETVVRGLRIPLELQQFPAGLELESEPVQPQWGGRNGTIHGQNHVSVAPLGLLTARPSARFKDFRRPGRAESPG